jgi:RHS repeat-associated protein
LRYSWDYEKHLYEATNRKRRIRYRYDALGRRISRYVAGGKENTKFTYDGNDVVLDDNSGVFTKYQNGLGIDNKLKMVTNGVSKYFLQDHLGSTTALTNSSGGVIESAAYDSFGNATGNLSTRYQFTGREYDNAIGLTYYRARWYSSELGRFVSEDPIGFAGGDVNLYAYVGNNPLRFVDPSGNQRFAERWDKNEVERGIEMQQHVMSMQPPQRKKTFFETMPIGQKKAVCDQVRELIRRENDYGTYRASLMSSVTVGGGTSLIKLKNEDLQNLPYKSNGITGTIDQDWLIDTRIGSPVFGTIGGYIAGKTFWKAGAPHVKPDAPNFGYPF